MITSLKIDWKDQFLPLLLNPSISSDWQVIEELKSNPLIRICDEIQSQIEDLIKGNHPEIQLSKNQLKQMALDFLSERDADKYGCWVFYPWKYSLVHLLPKEDFIKVRTLRNHYKITPSEQEELSQKNVERSHLLAQVERSNNCLFIHEQIRATRIEMNGTGSMVVFEATKEWEEKQKTRRAVLEKRIEGYQKQLGTCNK